MQWDLHVESLYLRIEHVPFVVVHILLTLYMAESVDCTVTNYLYPVVGFL